MESALHFPMEVCESNSSLNGSVESSLNGSIAFEDGILVKNFYYLRWEMLVEYAVMPLLLVIGFLCNMTFFLVCIRVPYMQSLPNIFLANLALTDLLYIIISTGYSLDSFNTIIRQDMGTFGVFGCHITYFAFWLCYFSSMLLLTVACFEQFMSVCYPSAHSVLLDNRLKSGVFTFLAFLTAAAISGIFQWLYNPHQVYCILEDFEEGQNKIEGSNMDETVVEYTQPLPVKMDLCHLDNKDFSMIIHVVRPSVWAFATLSCLFMFIVIYITFWRRDKIVESDANADVDNYRDPVVFMLLISTFITLLVWALPCLQDIFVILQDCNCMPDFTLQDRLLLSRVAAIITVVVSAFKPVIYSATHWRYREAYGQVFRMFSCGGRLKRNRSMRGGLTKSKRKK